MEALEPGAVRLRGVSRKFQIVHERNQTLKETLLRRRRAHTTELWALKEVDLDISPGESVGIVGQNGAGKSTLLKLIAGIIPPHDGVVEAGGTVASMLELGAGFHPDFTGRENVFMNGAILGIGEREVERRLPEIVAFSELAHFIDMPVKTYSSGMYMRLAFAVASHVNPDILLLDEVLAVGDETFQQKCFGRIFEYRRRGGTIVLVSHDPSAIERVCDRALLINDGAIVADGAPDDVLAEYHRRLAAGAAHAPPAPGSGQDGNADLQDTREWGTRDVVVVGHRLLNSTGQETTRFLSGERFEIELDVFAPSRVRTPNVGIMLNFAEGPLCYGTNTRIDGWPIEFLEGSGRVRFTVPALHLHSGRFTVTIAVSSHDESTIYHWLDRIIEFTVFQRGTGIGPVDVSGQWSLTAGAAESPELHRAHAARDVQHHNG